jgi:hypothetical protein
MSDKRKIHRFWGNISIALGIALLILGCLFLFFYQKGMVPGMSQKETRLFLLSNVLQILGGILCIFTGWHLLSSMKDKIEEKDYLLTTLLPITVHGAYCLGLEWARMDLRLWKLKFAWGELTLDREGLTFKPSKFLKWRVKGKEIKIKKDEITSVCRPTGLYQYNGGFVIQLKDSKMPYFLARSMLLPRNKVKSMEGIRKMKTLDIEEALIERINKMTNEKNLEYRLCENSINSTG